VQVKTLIAELQKRDLDAIVMFSYDYGDHSHTQAVDNIRRVLIRDLTSTGYSPSGFRVIEDEGDDYIPEPAMEDVVVLSS
jgi:hypothetical protein